MLVIKAFHIIFMVTWFSGLFYLPRLFVYHASASDMVSIERFKVMERKLYYYITTPGAVLTIVFGLWVLSYNFTGYMHMRWLHLKLGLVILLLAYHIYLGFLLQRFKENRNHHSELFFRVINEVPALFLLSIILLAVVKPFGTILL